MITQAIIAHYKDLGYKVEASLVGTQHDRIIINCPQTDITVEIVVADTMVILYKQLKGTIWVCESHSIKTPLFTADLTEPNSLQQLEAAVHTATT